MGENRFASEDKANKSIQKVIDEQFQTFVENIIISVLVIQNGKFVYVNPTFEHLSGYSADELYAMKSSLDIVSSRFRKRIRDIRSYMRKKRSKYPDQEIQIINRCGELIWIDYHEAVIDYQGRPAILASAIDVSECRQRTEERNYSEEKYRSLVENIHDIIYTLNKEGIFTFVSNSWTALLGHQVDDVVGKPHHIFLHPDHIQSSEDFIKETIQSGQKQSSIEFQVRHANGSWRWHTAKATVLRDANGEITGIQGIARDVTERKQFEDALRQSEEKYRGIFENISEGIYQTTPEGRFISVNPAMVKMFGYTSGAEMIDSVKDIKGQLYVDPGDRERQFEVFKNQDLFEYEAEMYRKDGQKLWMSLKTRVIRKQDGDVSYVEGICRDITAQKMAEIEIRESHHFLERVIESLPDATMVIDWQGRVVFWNKAIEEMTGVSKQDMIGRGDFEYAIPFYGKPCPILVDVALNPDDVYDQMQEKYKIINIDGETLSSEIYLPTTNNGRGSYLWVTASRLLDSGGNVIGAIESIRDISERKEMDKARAKDSAIQRMTLLSIGDAVISTDKYGNITLFNKAAEDLTGWTQEEALKRPLEDVFNIYNELTGARCDNPAHEVLKTGEIVQLSDQTVLVAKDGTERSIEDSAAPIKDEKGNINGVVLVFRDFTDKKARQDEIAYLSYHDHLTGLYNRRFLEEEIRRLDTERNLPITLIMGDINGLKLTNDAFGHRAGDRLLTIVSDIMRKECRTDDVIARVGGDEFVFLLPKTEDRKAQAIVERINARLARTKIDSIIPSVSFGWATKHEISESIENVSKLAEDHMYRLKLTASAAMKSRTIQSIIKTLYEKNKQEKKHSQNVSKICASIGNAVGMSQDAINELQEAALMHDVGKIAINETVLKKTGKFDESDWCEMQRHAEASYRIMSSVHEFAKMAGYVIAHHERWDGQGYPKGLKGEDIPLQARVMAVADAYDAMSSDRPYRKALSRLDIIREYKNNAGTQFDPDIARIFVERVLGERWE